MANRGEDNDEPEDLYGEDDMFSQRERLGDRRGQRPRVVSEFVRRAIENTVGSVTNTGNLSREALNYVLQQGDRGKREVVRIVAQEVGEFLRGIDLSSEVVKVLSNIQVEVNASIRFKPATDGSGSVKPEIDAETNVLIRDEAETGGEAGSSAGGAEAPAAGGAEPSKPPEST